MKPAFPGQNTFLVEQSLRLIEEMEKLPITDDPNFTSANWIGKGDCLLHPIPAGELTPLQKCRLRNKDLYHNHAIKMGLIKP
jgi:hypothetical protein